jgi:uncharacterized repeat protein (TIGR03803 family)
MYRPLMRSNRPHSTPGCNRRSGRSHPMHTALTLTPSMQYTALVTMNGDKGQCPCTLIQGSDGNLYGTTGSGGPGGGGTIFEIEVGLPAPAPQARSFQPSSGAKGTEVMIWGDNLLSGGPTPTFLLTPRPPYGGRTLSLRGLNAKRKELTT